MVTRLSITMMTVEVKVMNHDMMVTMTKMVTLMTIWQYGEGSIEIDVVVGIPRLDHLSTKH